MYIVLLVLEKLVSKPPMLGALTHDFRFWYVLVACFGCATCSTRTHSYSQGGYYRQLSDQHGSA